MNIYSKNSKNKQDEKRNLSVKIHKIDILFQVE